MKEFKFWAIPYSLNQILLIAIPVGIVFLFLMFSTDIFKYFGYLFAAVFIWYIFFFLFFVKRVRISFSESGVIHLYINGKEKIAAEPQQLELVRGMDIRRTTNRPSLYLVFNGKDFTFNLFENRNIKASKQQELLQYMVTTYNLQQEFYKKSLAGPIYTYRNPAFMGVSVTNYNKSEK